MVSIIRKTCILELSWLKRNQINHFFPKQKTTHWHDFNSSNFCVAAKLCMQKSLLLLNFSPVRAKTKDSASDSLEDQDTDDIQQYASEKCQRKGSVVDMDFQAAHTLSSSGGGPRPGSKEGSQVTHSDTKIKRVPDPLQAEEASACHSKPVESTVSQQDVSSPPSTPTRKSQFSRGRLRLLSFRSMEEPRAVPTVKEKYPILKNILDFIKDQSLSHER